MSLEQLIEEDMVQFLESEARTDKKEPVMRLEETYYVRRDWENEVRQHLKRNDLAMAKHVFGELSKYYSELPQSHTAERKHVYGTLQNCYLAIINTVRDQNRTKVLLQRMERSQDDVFDTHVKPVNLQNMQRESTPSMPELEPVTKENLHKHAQPDLTLPPPPEEPAVQLPQPPTVTPQLPPVSETTDVVAAYKAQVPAILEAAKKNTADARQRIQQIRALIEKAFLEPEKKAALLEKLRMLELTVQAHEEKKLFEQNFALKQQELLASAGTEKAIQLYTQLLKSAQAFEKNYPIYAGAFTNTLEQLKKAHDLYTEDEIIELLSPILTKLKNAIRAHDATAYISGVGELERFTLSLPRSEQRTLLEHAVEVLKAKTKKRDMNAPVGVSV